MSTNASTAGRVPARGPNLLAIFSACALFIAERLFADGTGHLVILTSAIVALVVALVQRGIERARSSGDAARALAPLLASKGALVLGAGLYALWRTWSSRDASAPDAVEPRTLALVLLTALFFIALGLVALVAAELALAPMRDAGIVEQPRLRAATMAAASAVVGLFALGLLNFGAHTLDWRRDLSVNAPRAPSSATRSLIDAAPSPVTITLFFERGSTALAEVKDYFDALASSGVAIETLDFALDPALSAKLKVAKNGTIVVSSGERSESWFLGVDRDNAARKAKKLDEEIRTRVAKVTREVKQLYFTSGHGERDLRVARPGERHSISAFKTAIEQLNTKITQIGIANGLSEKVPDDAAVVVIVGPTGRFQESEVDALLAYVERGGALFVFVDPGVDAGLDRLLAALATKPPTVELVNDQEFVRQSHTPADHAFIYAASFTSHKAIRGLQMSRDNPALLFFSSTALVEEKREGVRRTALAKSRQGTFVDVVPNRAFDADRETRAVSDLVVAVEGDPPKAGAQATDDPARELRAIVVGDSDIVHDVLFLHPANRAFVDDAILWLLRDDVAGGAAVSDDDVPIRHTRDGDVAWFYGTTFLAPLVVLVGGLAYVAARRRRRT